MLTTRINKNQSIVINKKVNLPNGKHKTLHHAFFTQLPPFAVEPPHLSDVKGL